MKLSDAMRKGAAMKPQTTRGGFQDFEMVDGTEVSVATCALGAAMDALGVLSRASGPLAYFPVLRDAGKVACPKCEWQNVLFGVITHLNDEHAEPRERIADWLEDQGL